MRTTLDIDDDVLAAVKELARRERVAVGRGLFRLARQDLTGSGPHGEGSRPWEATKAP